MRNSFVNKLLKGHLLWIISIIIFLLLALVFDKKNNFWEVANVNRQLKKLEEQREYYQQKITQDSTTIENLKDDTFLEHYAREHYLMKRQGEVIYIIKE